MSKPTSPNQPTSASKPTSQSGPGSPLAVRVQSLGCKVNQHEAACLLAGLLSVRGVSEAGRGDTPGLYVINTCAVTRRAEAESRQLVRRALREGARVVAVGCAVDADPNLAEACELALGNAEKAGLATRLFGEAAAGESLPRASHFDGRSRATLKVQDGCNGGCSYCIVPRLRGRSRSVPVAEVIAELERLAGLGFPEVVLCAVHLGAYGADLEPATTLADLLAAIIAAKEQRGLKLRVRLSSLEPPEALEIVPLLATTEAICRHLHISLQSGSDAVLSRMRRHYLAWSLRGLVLAACARIPGLAVGCDVIAGFPGETAEEFNETCELLSQLPLSYLHVFPYSPRPKTLAATMPGQVPSLEKARRAAALRELSAKMRKAFAQAQVGSVVQAVLQGRDRATRLPTALTDNYVPVLLDLRGRRPPPEGASGLIRVRIDRVVDSRMIATPL